MEPISLSTAGVIFLSMAAGAMISKLFQKKAPASSIDESKEQAINDLIVDKQE
ncbi:MAG: hypothetical protein HQL20_09830 [Candidatus Omnitrophica bacterium]|nr:hypothetical protein [Candidatus Omnitrophota bacterium]